MCKDCKRQWFRKRHNSVSRADYLAYRKHVANIFKRGRLVQWADACSKRFSGRYQKNWTAFKQIAEHVEADEIVPKRDWEFYSIWPRLPHYNEPGMLDLVKKVEI